MGKGTACNGREVGIGKGQSGARPAAEDVVRGLWRLAQGPVFFWETRGWGDPAQAHELTVWPRASRLPSLGLCLPFCKGGDSSHTGQPVEIMTAGGI